MEKRVIKSIIAEKQKEILDVELIARPFELEDSCNYVFVGVRRAGKSYLLFQHIHQLIKDGKASRNVEQPFRLYLFGNGY